MSIICPMKTLGYIKERFLIHLTFWTTMGLCILLNALRLLGATIEESIFGISENKRVNLEQLNKKYNLINNKDQSTF